MMQAPTFKTFRVVFARMPTNYNPEEVLFIEAQTPDDAKRIWTGHIERTRHMSAWSNYVVQSVTETTPLPAGRVL